MVEVRRKDGRVEFEKPAEAPVENDADALDNELRSRRLTRLSLNLSV
jgi:hypothetical protein